MGDIESIWEAWLLLTAIDDIRHGTNQGEYKRDYIQFHAVMINAFGYAVQRLLADYAVREVVAMIEALAMATGTAEREDFFLMTNWGGICVNTDKDKPTVIANVAAQKAAADRLVKVIAKKSLIASAKD